MKVILTQTDTTVGFLSQNEQRLKEIKERASSKPFIEVYPELKILLSSGHRVPNRFKNRIRRSTKTTFIIKNRAFRVAKNSLDSQILRDSLWHYSTSANEKSKKFNRDFCEYKADIIIEDRDRLRELSASSLYKLNQIKIEKIR